MYSHINIHIYTHNTHRDLCTNTKICGDKYGFLYTHKYTQVYTQIHKCMHTHKHTRAQI